MNTYTVKSMNVSGKGRRVFKTGDTVKENDFFPGSAEKLCEAGHLTRKYPYHEGICIGILIPTRGDRAILLEQATRLIEKQTLQPQVIEIVDDPPVSNAIDITYRYRIGCERLLAKGAELILFWEDDDWYAPNYIQTMYINWIKWGKPPIFGIENSIYYHILDLKYFIIHHRNRASMMATMITKKALSNLKWGEDDYPYTDTVVWKEVKGRTFIPPVPICLGIKHGIGMVGGGGHDSSVFKHYNRKDPQQVYLKSIVKDDFEFYANLKNNFVKSVAGM